MRTVKPHPSLHTLDTLFVIRHSTLYWRDTNKPAGTLHSKGYMHVPVNGSLYYVHRLMWMMYNRRQIPKGYQIDHRDRDRSNNSRRNLRIVTAIGNGWNRKDNARHPCVVPHQTKHGMTYQVYVSVDQRTRYCGSYPTQRQAVMRRNEVLKSLKREIPNIKGAVK